MRFGPSSLRRILAIMRKEWWHITRDRIAFSLLILSPVLLLITMAYAFSIDIDDVAIGILDRDPGPVSRRYVARLVSSGDLVVGAQLRDRGELERRIRGGEIHAAVVIPMGFGEDLHAGRTATLQVIVDGTEPNTAGHAIRHITGHTETFAAEYAARAGALALAPVELRARAWYNPSLRFPNSIIPPLVGIVLSVPAMAASLALAREREWGTLEALMASPVGRLELILGKLIPYILTGMLSVPLSLLTAVLVFGVPFRGSVTLFLGLSALFLFATMSMAMLLSVFVKTQQVAIIGSMIIFLFPGFFLSGLLIPYSVMGPLIKLEAMFFPTTHFVLISRGLLVKGLGLSHLLGNVLALTALGTGCLGLSVLLFHKKLA